MKITSLNDFKVPDGLFPELDSYFIERVALQAIGASQPIEIGELNEYFNAIDELFEWGASMLDDPGFH